MMRRIPAQNDLDQFSAFPSRTAMDEHGLLLVRWRRPTTAVIRFHLLNVPLDLLGASHQIRTPTGVEACLATSSLGPR
jgi:hypothetical protein